MSTTEHIGGKFGNLVW